jgi:hypothetical protein
MIALMTRAASRDEQPTEKEQCIVKIRVAGPVRRAGCGLQ